MNSGIKPCRCALGPGIERAAPQVVEPSRQAVEVALDVFRRYETPDVGPPCTVQNPGNGPGSLGGLRALDELAEIVPGNVVILDEVRPKLPVFGS
jgi:hypothetical protein